MTEAVQNRIWTTEHVLFLEVVFKFYLFKFQVLSGSKTLEKQDLPFEPLMWCFARKSTRMPKEEAKKRPKRRPNAAASLQFPIRVL